MASILPLICALWSLSCTTSLATNAPQEAQGPRTVREMPPGRPPLHEIERSAAKRPQDMQSYRETIPGTSEGFDLVPLQGGSFLLGSPADEDDRKVDEGPQVEVQLSPFWIGIKEVSWDEYHEFMSALDIARRRAGRGESAPQDPWADAVSRPTPPYVPMDFNMGVDGFPAVCMTQFAARQYTKWLSMKTGRFYRLPSEAEWEYACRAGSSTSFSFGAEVDDLEDHAWFFDNGDDTYHKCGELPPNAFGLHDMHGNVAEWCLDAFDPKFYSTLKKGALDPINWPSELYPRVARGGSWDHDAEDLRCARRIPSTPGWKVQDPQIPKSIWFHTDAPFLGFRVVRPLSEPTPEETVLWWETKLKAVRIIETRQRNGDR
ncbi:MAG TPA: formylglycine-generating enzyme family protein [Planctomycetes bacterium]|nr:formylglycine-generating enzyme family protein [Planctomycetota bacterium]HIL37350.1 formylglycine-generating enzyme family protein [Planctomycetota bacterium]